MLNIWWVFSIGTTVCLLFAVGFVGTLLLVQRQKFRMEQEKVAALEESQRRLETLLRQSELMQEDLSFVSRALASVQEDERKRISRELHDEVGQLLAVMGLNLEIALKSLLGENTPLHKRIADTEALVNQVHDRLRQFLKDLRPIALGEQGGLAPALRQLANQQSNRSGICIDLEGDLVTGEDDGGVDCELTNEQKVTLYRVAQEGVTNAIKHARARRITISLRCQDCSSSREALSDHGANRRHVVMEVRDDGCGFGQTTIPYPPPSEARGTDSRSVGLGLLGMRERVKLLGGEFQIDSIPGEGTALRVRVPLDDATPPGPGGLPHE